MKIYTHCANNLAVDAVIEKWLHSAVSVYISRNGHVAYNRKCGTKFQTRVAFFTSISCHLTSSTHFIPSLRSWVSTN